MNARSPREFRAVVTARAKEAARGSVRSAGDLEQHFYISRLIARVFRADPDGWVLKGGQALLARYPDARHSRDTDLLYQGSDGSDLDAAVAALRDAATLESDDAVGFLFYDCTEPSDDRAGVTARFGVFVGTTRLTTVSVDVVVDHTPIGSTVVVPLIPVIDVTGVEDWPDIRLYPVLDHVADKICAMLERHGPQARGSTRYRDLADLIFMIGREELDGAQLHTVLRKEVLRRQSAGVVTIELPRDFAVPDVALWTPGYARVAKDVENFEEFRTLPPAQRLAVAFVDPLLAETPPGAWNPATRTWC